MNVQSFEFKKCLNMYFVFLAFHSYHYNTLISQDLNFMKLTETNCTKTNYRDFTIWYKNHVEGTKCCENNVDRSLQRIVSSSTGPMDFSFGLVWQSKEDF